MMAKKRRKHGAELTPEELEYLCQGYTVDGYFFGAPEPFESEEQAAEAWNNHVDEVWEAFHASDTYRIRSTGNGQHSKPWAARQFATRGSTMESKSNGGARESGPSGCG